MSRKSDTIAREFLIHNSHENVSKCKICDRPFKGSFVSNLKRHLRECHAEAYKKETDQSD